MKAHRLSSNPPHEEGNNCEMAIEKKIYEQVSKHGGHEGLLRYHGPYQSGIRLEYACNGSLRAFIQTRAGDIGMAQRLCWAE